MGQGAAHPPAPLGIGQGLILGYREGDARKDMRIADRAAAIDKVEDRFGASLKGMVVTLNVFR